MSRTKFAAFPDGTFAEIVAPTGYDTAAAVRNPDGTYTVLRAFIFRREAEARVEIEADRGVEAVVCHVVSEAEKWAVLRAASVEENRKAFYRYTVARISGPAAYGPIEEVQALIDAGDAEAAGERLTRLYVDELGYDQYAGFWDQDVVTRAGGVRFTDRWFVATVKARVCGRHGEIVVPAGVKVLARAERDIRGVVDGYKVFDTATGSNLGRVGAWHLDTSAEPSAVALG